MLNAFELGSRRGIRTWRVVSIHLGRLFGIHSWLRARPRVKKHELLGIDEVDSEGKSLTTREEIPVVFLVPNETGAAEDCRVANV